MAQYINTNVSSLNSQRNLGMSQTALATSLQRLSSGLRINSAKDDAAGMSISDRMSSQIRGLDQARRNANDGVSLAQTAEGALSTAGDMLQRIRELAVQASNATNTTSDRAALQAEANQLTSELDRLAATTQFNGQNLLDGSFSSAAFQVGANANQTITSTTGNFRTANYGNYRIGAQVATTSSAVGDLTTGSLAGSLQSNGTLGTSTRVAAGSFTINGSAGTANINYIANDSAKTVAAAINAKTLATNVTATAKTEVDLSAMVQGGAYSVSIQSNNSTAISITFNTGTAGGGGVTNGDDLASAIKAFNDVTAATGVTAKLNTAGTGITLNNSTGENVNLVNNSVAAAAAFTVQGVANGAGAVPPGGVAVAGAAAQAVSIAGEISLDSTSSFGLANMVATDFFNASAASAQLQKVNQIDISSVAGATRAINQVDSALASVNSQRSSFGALQSRFSSTIANLQSTSENLSSARSRIQDTDFATETAQLTRAQILQQAGTAMLAQANAVPNGVMALLR